MEWIEPWQSLEDEQVQASHLERELYREVSRKHSLFGLRVKCVGRRQDCDYVLFALEDGTQRYAVVHLTWTSNPPDQEPWPHTEIYATIEEWIAKRMLPDHELCGESSGAGEDHAD